MPMDLIMGPVRKVCISIEQTASEGSEKTSHPSGFARARVYVTQYSISLELDKAYTKTPNTF